MRRVGVHLSRCEATRALCISAATVALSAGILSPASAQESGQSTDQAAQAGPAVVTPANAAHPADDSNQIVVTGTQLGGGFTSPTPVNVVSNQRLEDLAITNVAEALNELPSFRATTTPVTNQYFTNTNIGANIADLRGLGSARTLVLVDGRRFVASNNSGGVDLNAIPTTAISRAEVVTGGASAAYGSDAVAGVINLILDTKFNGFKLQSQFGIAEQGDAEQYQASFLYGTPIGDRAHIMVAGEFDDNKGTGNCFARAWCYRNINVLGNPSQGTNGLPAQILSGNQYSTLPDTGLIILGGDATGTTFNADGTPRPYQYGELSGALLQIGGEPGNTEGQQSWYRDYLLQVPVKRYSLFSHADFDVSDSVSLFAEISFAKVRGVSIDYPYLDIYAPVSVDNAYLPDSVRQAAISSGWSTIYLNRSDNDFGNQRAVSDNKTFRTAVGAHGELGSHWSWDAYYQYGRNTGRLDIYNNGNVAKHNQALDAVVGPGGQIVCRSTLTNPNDGCVPINLFGYGLTSPAGIDYVNGDAWQTRTFEQNVVAATVRGEPFSTWAGPVEVAFGGEYRADSARGTADDVSLAGGWQNNTATAIKGDIHVYEFFAEGAVPLASHVSWANDLELNGAIRYTHYNLSGGVDTWKVGGIYEPISALRFRATRSRDIRAPNIDELFASSGQILSNIIDPVNNSQNLIPTKVGGNPALKPEIANTFTAGIVIAPTGSVFSRLRFSVDYFDIKIKDAIDTVDAQSLVNLCNQGLDEACAAVTRDNSGTLVLIEANKRNLNKVRTSGLDFVLDYTLPFSAPDTRLNFNMTATYVDKLQITDIQGNTIDRAGQPGSPSAGPTFRGVPHWQLNGLASFKTGPIGLNLQGRYIEGGAYDTRLVGPGDKGYDPSLPNSISNNHVAGRFYLNAGASYDFKIGDKNIEVYVAVENLFDKDPPFTLASTLVDYFDALGRYYKAGLRVRL